LAAGLDGALSSAAAQEAPFTWTGVYLGAQMGGAVDHSHFSDPYGSTLFGDTVSSPGAFGGLQIGGNYQSGIAVFGLQADINGTNMQGNFTCMQPALGVPAMPPTFVGGFFGATCKVEPDLFGTLTARAGVAVGPQGRILLYGKGGLAWQHSDIDMAINNSVSATYGPTNARSSANFTQLGWTLGGGAELALAGRWSLALEYDFLHFGDHEVATPASGAFASPATPGIVGSGAPDGRLASMSQDVHAVKVALNYRLNDTGVLTPLDDLVAAVRPVRLSGWETEVGARYVYGSMRFQKDLGKVPLGLPVNNSRLTWNNVDTNGGELFGRVDTPENIMVKGFLGAGQGDQGHINDEDWGNLESGPLVTGYSNTDSPVTDRVRYFTLDLGYDVLRASNYKIAPFVGYNYYRYMMNAYDCVDAMYSPPQVCDPNDPPHQLFLQEKDTWISLRLGTSAELMLTPQLKLTGEVAWVPYVRFAGVDNHPQRTEMATTYSPAHASGNGVQVEGVLSYDVTQEFSVGVGGRYWAMTAPGWVNYFSTGRQLTQSFEVEQTAVFVQGSYKFTLSAD
jgi:opacity protein-like surface antigen